MALTVEQGRLWLAEQRGLCEHQRIGECNWPWRVSAGVPDPTDHVQFIARCGVVSAKRMSNQDATMERPEWGALILENRVKFSLGKAEHKRAAKECSQ